MKNNLLYTTLDLALAALVHLPHNEIEQLSLRDSAFLLDILPDTDTMAAIRAPIAIRLSQQLNSTWISEGDLFEVFLALDALWKYDPLQVNGEHLAYAIQRLVRSERQAGGPYTCSDGVIDIVANLQIASFVRMIAKPLPRLNTFFDQIITAGHFKDTAQSAPYALYLLTRHYDDPGVIRLVTTNPSKTPATRAVALTTLAYDTVIFRQELKALCSRQQSTGFWPAEDLIRGQTTSYITTTTLIVACLMEYQSDSSPVKKSSGLQRQHQLVGEVTKQLFKTRAEPLRRSTIAAVDKICSVKKTSEITLLSYFFARALKPPTDLSDQQLAMLGAANVCGWVAYTIYDDFLDDEGAPPQLPVANLTMRAALDCFRAVLPLHCTFEHYVANVFAEMDEANAWEVNNCRFIVRDNTITISRLPKYGRQAVLAARSFAHALGPMAILINYTRSTPQQVRSIESAFRHYLIARQLSDDLYDWVNDIKAGQASYVVIAILREMHAHEDTYALSVLLSSMQKQFRRTTLPHVCLLALRHITTAKRNFIKSDLLQPTNSIYTILDELESSLRYSLDQHEKAEALIKTRVSYSS